MTRSGITRHCGAVATRRRRRGFSTTAATFASGVIFASPAAQTRRKARNRHGGKRSAAQTRGGDTPERRERSLALAYRHDQSRRRVPRTSGGASTPPVRLVHRLGMTRTPPLCTGSAHLVATAVHAARWHRCPHVGTLRPSPMGTERQQLCRSVSAPGQTFIHSLEPGVSGCGTAGFSRSRRQSGDEQRPAIQKQPTASSTASQYRPPKLANPTDPRCRRLIPSGPRLAILEQRTALSTRRSRPQPPVDNRRTGLCDTGIRITSVEMAAPGAGLSRCAEFR